MVQRMLSESGRKIVHVSYDSQSVSADFFRSWNNGVGILLFVMVFSFLRVVEVQKKRPIRSGFLRFFSSVAAVFVYSFFQEWFYLRVVYFQWIALFPFFTERSAVKVRFRFHRKNITILLCLILVLLFGSWFLFPTKTFRSGIYFPPKGRGYKAWILEGNGKMSLASRPELYLITPNREMDRRSTLSISVSGGYRKIHPRTIKGLKEEYLAFRTVKGKNILKTECTLRQKTDPFRTLNFWSRRPLDPEPRKICSQIRIRKKVDLLPKKVLRKRFKKRS